MKPEQKELIKQVHHANKVYFDVIPGLHPEAENHPQMIAARQVVFGKQSKVIQLRAENIQYNFVFSVVCFRSGISIE